VLPGQVPHAHLPFALAQQEFAPMTPSRKRAPKINPRNAWYRLAIRRSAIDSWGVFAQENIPRGKRVIEYTGKRLTFGQASLLRPPKDTYLARVALDTVLDGATRGSGAEFINHCCDPNLRWKRSRGRLMFYSRRRIRAGEELTFRYAYPVKFVRIPCRCGSPKCKGTLRYIFR
jgi:SET domain-containing protein